MPMLGIIGSYLSPYVRKVLVTLDLKGIAYEIDPIIPFFGNEEFSRLSPLRRIPVLIDGDVVLSDSSVICQYLEDKYPASSIYPADIAQRAQARWIEEYADTRLGDVLIWKLYNETVIKPFVWKKPTDLALLEKVKTHEIPQVLDYLEGVAPAQGFVFGKISIADISIAAFFRNAAIARYEIDVSRWPKTAAWVNRVLAEPSFQKLKTFEDKLIRTPIPHHREALEKMGAPLTLTSYASASPRQGFFQ